MAETQTDLKRKAAERRERILNSAALRMSRIHGHPVEETVPPDDAVAHEASVETPLHTERPMSGIDVAARYEVASEAKEREKKKQPSSGSPFETAAVVMHVTHRLQILVASLLAVWYAVYGWASSSPLGLLFVSEVLLRFRWNDLTALSQVTLISGSWMYLALVPSLKTRQVCVACHGHGRWRRVCCRSSCCVRRGD